MYIVMCEIYRKENENYKLCSAHPIKAVRREPDVREWMREEPEIIVRYLQDVLGNSYSIAERDENHAELRTDNGAERRIYIAKKI